jgi:fatty-acid desaturase
MLVHLHSGLRWVILILLVMAIVNAAMKMNGSSPFSDRDRRLGLYALTGAHIQLILGFVLYFISPKVAFVAETMSNASLRFYTVEHISVMIIGIVLITIGYSRTKRATDDGKKFKNTFWFYLIGLLLILSRIPWPFQEGLGAGWG